ncbi:helix-turn-helix domain-containing protein [Fibrivirga algicola]|uniref:Helix-turn-helix domain-containing protein n=1 Tax=Fibrivirga algicola TaxID=2950420 RepID=A0ABX0QD07_9BACT|nr:helix-turn-helix domain-containing protein [Fibrivirga algicola]
MRCRAYKARQRSAKVEISNQQTEQIRLQPIATLRAEEYLIVDESARLVRISRRTLYRLIERGELPVTKLRSFTVIRRANIDRLFETPTPTQKTSAAS